MDISAFIRKNLTPLLIGFVALCCVLGQLEFLLTPKGVLIEGMANPTLTQKPLFPVNQVGLACMVLALTLIVIPPWKNRKSPLLNYTRTGLLGLSFGLGAYYFYRYLTLSNFNLIHTFAYPHPLPVSAEETIHLMLSSFCIWLIWKHHRNGILMGYVIGIASIILLSLNLFAVYGELSNFPVLTSFGQQFFSIVAYLCLSFLFMVVTIPYQGLFLPLTVNRRDTMALSIVGLVKSLGIIVLSMFLFSQVRALIPANEANSNAANSLFLIFEYSTILINALITLAYFRAIYYFIRSLRMEEDLLRLNLNLEKKVMARTAELKTANDELKGFSYTVSKGLTNPLRIMLKMNEMVQDSTRDRLTGEEQDLLDRIHRRGQEANDLVYSLLDLSTTDSVAIHRDTVDLSNLIHSIAIQLEEQFPERQVKMIIQPDLYTSADAHLLAVAMTKLMENAWKYTESKPDACIEFGQVEQNGETRYFLHDNGIGFDMERAKHRLFKPFESLHEDPALKGNGIGLATVARIIRRHKGQIYAIGEPGKGATFYFTLSGTSVQKPEDEDVPPNKIAAAAFGRQNVTAGNKTATERAQNPN